MCGASWTKKRNTNFSESSETGKWELREINLPRWMYLFILYYEPKFEDFVS